MKRRKLSISGDRGKYIFDKENISLDGRQRIQNTVSATRKWHVVDHDRVEEETTEKTTPTTNLSHVIKKSGEEIRLYSEIERLSDLLFSFKIMNADVSKSLQAQTAPFVRGNLESILASVKTALFSIFNVEPGSKPIIPLWTNRFVRTKSESNSEGSLSEDEKAFSLLISPHPKCLDLVCLGCAFWDANRSTLNWKDEKIPLLMRKHGWKFISYESSPRKAVILREKDQQVVNLWLSDKIAYEWHSIQVDIIKTYIQQFPSALLPLSQLVLSYFYHMKLLMRPNNERVKKENNMTKLEGLAPLTVVQLVYWYLFHISKKNGISLEFWPVLGRLNKAHTLIQAAQSGLPHLGRLAVGFFEYYSTFNFEQHKIDLKNPPKLLYRRGDDHMGLKISDPKVHETQGSFQLSAWLEKGGQHCMLPARINVYCADACSRLARPQLYQRSLRWARLGHLFIEALLELEQALGQDLTAALCPPRQPPAGLYKLAARARTLNMSRKRVETVLRQILCKGPLSLQEVEAKLTAADRVIRAELRNCGGAHALLAQLSHVCWLEDLDFDSSLQLDEEEDEMQGGARKVVLVHPLRELEQDKTKMGPSTSTEDAQLSKSTETEKGVAFSQMPHIDDQSLLAEQELEIEDGEIVEEEDLEFCQELQFDT